MEKEEEQIKYKCIIEPLLTWYNKTKRILPWREQAFPYYIWVSEIMLQQTRVEAVKGYFTRFIAQLPTIEHLAMASEDKILKLWEGLGYYNRVRNMQKTAIIVTEQYKGQFPNSYHELLQLPGIGSYTAGAIASIAFQLPVPAVDGNVLRVTKRITGSFDDITKTSVKKELEKQLTEIMPKENPGNFNQALMELGAVICLPNGKPLCNQCPISSLCYCYQKDLTDQIPVKKAKKARKIETKTILILEYKGKFALNQRPAKGLLAGLYEFPNVEGYLKLTQLDTLLKDLKIEEYKIELLGKKKHIFSHVEWHMIGYKINIQVIREQQTLLLESNPYLEKNLFLPYFWCTAKDLKETYALPTAFEAYRPI